MKRQLNKQLSKNSESDQEEEDLSEEDQDFNELSEEEVCFNSV